MKIPNKGFYQHYKHDPAGVPFNYTYAVIGLAKNTEDRSYTVLYMPLYENSWLAPADYAARPLEMFMEDVTVDGKTVPRFTEITDVETIAKLKIVKDQMYK